MVWVEIWDVFQKSWKKVEVNPFTFSSIFGTFSTCKIKGKGLLISCTNENCIFTFDNKSITLQHYVVLSSSERSKHLYIVNAAGVSSESVKQSHNFISFQSKWWTHGFLIELIAWEQYLQRSADTLGLKLKENVNYY
jgi:hypothetical protein